MCTCVRVWMHACMNLCGCVFTYEYKRAHTVCMSCMVCACRYTRVSMPAHVRVLLCMLMSACRCACAQLCMRVCVCARAAACERVHTTYLRPIARKSARAHAHMYACTHTRIHARTHARIHARTHALIHARTHARMHARALARTHARLCMLAHLQTHTHTHGTRTACAHALCMACGMNTSKDGAWHAGKTACKKKKTYRFVPPSILPGRPRDGDRSCARSTCARAA